VELLGLDFILSLEKMLGERLTLTSSFGALFTTAWSAPIVYFFRSSAIFARWSNSDLELGCQNVLFPVDDGRKAAVVE
jgi:divalent metal cation (Fe/Co/Zn/Cd) transporter